MSIAENLVQDALRVLPAGGVLHLPALLEDIRECGARPVSPGDQVAAEHHVSGALVPDLELLGHPEEGVSLRKRRIGKRCIFMFAAR